MSPKVILVFLVSLGLLAFAPNAMAADYKCQNGAVKKSGSTKFTYHWSGTNLTIKKSGSTKGQAVKSGSGYSVKVSGSTKAQIVNGKIKKSGSSWGTVSEAQQTWDCPDTVAATLWVLNKLGVI